MKRLIGFSVWVLIMLAEPAVCQLDGPVSRKSLAAKIRIDHNVVVENQRVLEIFLDLLRGTGIHGGFAEIGNCSDLPKGSLRLKQGASLREAMDALVAANPSYQWELQDGVINLMPRVGVSFLSTKIGKFQMDATDREIRIVIQDLLRLPEVREHEADFGLKPGYWSGGPGVYDEHPVPRQPVSVHINLQNLSLQRAFNRIAEKSQKAVWIYHETDCGGNKSYTVEIASD
jgi:hypothetical protein